MSGLKLDRRRFLGLTGAGASSLALAGCDVFDPLLRPGAEVRSVLEKANDLTYRVQRALIGDETLAREFSESEIRQGQRPNGSTDPTSMEYMFLSRSDFVLYKLRVTGLVEQPLELSLEELRNMPARTQITRHDCVEGWSCIAKWTGVPLAFLLDQARVRPEARYAVFRCYDEMPGGLAGPQPYYGSIDLIDARHPQTILAYGLNDQTLPIANGAPLRLRVERQLGYKMNKYVHTIELVESFADIGRGKGGYWEDHGYDWYAGI
ncbi:molybdopterin oxidoreductase [Arsenicitalea aurantiaca]|uniref:Molybdopterin oxidoreductase n=1 Tax=Arsenicitalea aurantiaca TaxID=1783274 RepID=A0A433XLL5_9HYPH|nr:molybdopterin-binding protein [Arsenicitalea aurantiaca]RUT34914.1 molybdopterin oxidoreductase [Arsenicitalea aurantiaca]